MANKSRPKKVRAPYRSYKAKKEEKHVASVGIETQENTHIIHDQLKNNEFKLGVQQRPFYNSTKSEIVAGESINNAEALALAPTLAQDQIQVQDQNQAYLPLPIELFAYILEIVNANGDLDPSLMRVCKDFYKIVRPMIYRHPRLKATSFANFVETLSSNKSLGDYIHSLDLSFVQSSKNAFVARLLKQTRKNLEDFVAPQTSFGLGPLIAVKNCLNLKTLDLRLVSETLNLTELFHSMSNLNQLTHLSFPRSSVDIENYNNIKWPPKLTFLRLSGGINDEFLSHSNLPELITSLEFAHCPLITDIGIRQVLCKMGQKLRNFKVQYPMPSLKGNSLDDVFVLCPKLRVLEVCVDYLSSTFFDEHNLRHVNYERPLRTLYINSSGLLGTLNRLGPADLAMALEDGRLPYVKNIQCTAKLSWDPKSDAVISIADELDERGGGLYIGY